MNNEDNYVDKTVLSTPEPKAFSTEHKKKVPRSLNNTYNNDSLGLAQTKSEDLPSRISEGSIQLQKQRLLANSVLQKTSRLSSLPSRYLKSSDISKQAAESCFNVSGGSTISESDLLFCKSKNLQGDTSTPRESMASNSGIVNPPRPSLGKSISRLSNKLMDTNLDLESVTAELQKMLHSNVIIEEDSDLFTSVAAAEEKLAADELSWRREKDIPGKTSMCFTEDTSFPMKVSMGEFFKMKSENISDLDIVTTSPVKTEPPVPLIDPEVTFANTTMTADGDISAASDPEKSLSISNIAKILEDTQQTPRKALSYLFNNMMKKNKNVVEDLTSSEKCRAYLAEESMRGSTFSSRLPATASAVYENKSPDYEPNNKENINCLNIPGIPIVTSGQCQISDSANTSIVSRKSPINPSNTDRSLTSVRSASSLSNLAGGKLPIDASRTELVWGCVKPGKSVTQEVTIRNKSQNRLRFQCSLSGPSYKILKDHPDSEYVSIAKYVLQPGESKRIFISFAPIQLGAAVDSVAFSPTDPSLNQYRSQKINLFGYGGHGNVEVSHVTKDITGKFWLCLGDLGNRPSLSKVIKLQNTGTLPAFGFLSFDSKDISSFSNISVSSDKFVLLPQEKMQVTVTFTPSKRDLKLFQSSLNNLLLELGVLKLISGSEVTRARLTKLCKLAMEKKLTVIQICHTLSENIPGQVVPEDLHLFKETIKSVSELLQELSIQEIVLTLEQDPEATLLAHFPEDSVSFQTLCHDMSYDVDCVEKVSFWLEPSCIILTPPMKTRDLFILNSDHGESATYEVKCESSDLIITDKKGTIDPGRPVPIYVECNMCVDRITVYKVIIVINDCILDSTVKVLNIR